MTEIGMFAVFGVLAAWQAVFGDPAAALWYGLVSAAALWFACREHCSTDR